MLRGMGKIGMLFWFCLLMLVFSGTKVHAQGKFTISGYVKDSANGENLMDAAVFVVELTKGASTNSYGFYSLTLPEGKYTLRVTYIGYAAQQMVIDLNKDTRLNIELSNKTSEMQEVVVTGKKSDNVESTDLGRQEVSIETSKALPAFMGEVDILKTIQLLPGIMSSGEGNTGFYVRGGGADQNLVLLDNATVYNTGHLLGFFSVFNPDAIKDVTVIKGGMPAEYGGRISSVVDIQQKDGDMRKWDVEGGLGLISSRLTVQGPIKKDKCSIIISARRTYIDLLLKPVLANINNGAFAGNSYYFYDINAKLNWRFSDRDRLELSGYFGRDAFNFVAPGGEFNVNFPWGNETGTMHWTHLFSDKLFLNTMFIYNEFGFKANTGFQNVTFDLNSAVQEATAKMEFEYSPFLGHLMKFGWQYNFHIFTPYETSGSAGSTDFSTTDQAKKYAGESAIYFQDDFEANDWLKINAGLRASLFNFLGPFSEIQFDQYGQATDTLNYKAGQNIKTYWGLEPRLSLRFKLDKNSSIKTGAALNRQYVSQVSSSTTTLPIDLWVPSTAIVKPQTGLQTSVGYFRNFKDDMFEVSAEIYFKYLWNQIEFGESAVPVTVTEDVEDQFVFGRGWCYGAEFFAKKAKGKWTGWISYTLGWAWRKFPQIDNGTPFLAQYDRRHDISIVNMYEINKHWKISATWVFQTGNRVTLPTQYYLIEGQPSYNYGPRDWYQMPSYHRLDLGFTYSILPKKQRKVNFLSDITVSLYNAYNRLNPFFIYIYYQGNAGGGSGTQSGNTKSLSFTAEQVSLFPILPAVTWNFKF
jgi:hypothetical protein